MSGFCDADICKRALPRERPRVGDHVRQNEAHTFSGYGFYLRFHPECCPREFDGTVCLRDHGMGTSATRVEARRKNATLVDDGTPAGRLYSRLLHVQIDLQEAEDEEAEELLTDLLDEWTTRIGGPR